MQHDLTNSCKMPNAIAILEYSRVPVIKTTRPTGIIAIFSFFSFFAKTKGPQKVYCSSTGNLLSCVATYRYINK